MFLSAGWRLSRSLGVLRKNPKDKCMIGKKKFFVFQFLVIKCPDPELDPDPH
jgi:hypothetical protein